jgi:hypothetical protein
LMTSSGKRLRMLSLSGEQRAITWAFNKMM